MARPIPNLFLQVQATIGCDCKVKVQDDTNYVNLGGLRSDFGLALFWSTDAFIANFSMDLTSPGDNINPALWNLITTSGSTLGVMMYAIPNYLQARNYVLHEITYYNGKFWIAAAPILSGADVPGVNDNWDLVSITPSVAYMTFYNYVSSAVLLSYNVTAITQSCSYISLTKTSCYNYSIVNNTNAIEFFSVTDLSGNVITLTTNVTPILDDLGNLLGYSMIAGATDTFTLPKEGVYIINYGSAITCMTSQKVIFEFCKYYKCYFELIKKMLCDPFDPCCDDNKHHKRHHISWGWGGRNHKEECYDCDEEKKRQHEIFRFTLNKMQALINTLQIKTFFDTTQYGNIMAVPSNRLTELTEIESILKMLNDIIVRCGLCNGAWSGNAEEKECGCNK